jgi:hypothetical protein
MVLRFSAEYYRLGEYPSPVSVAAGPSDARLDGLLFQYFRLVGMHVLAADQQA